MQSEATIRVRAPATTANIGPGFDCAGAALDLWNELELTPGDEPADRTHLGVRAFERLVPAVGWSFHFTDRIPQARGLGSSAAVVALGLVAAAIVGKLEPTADELLALGIELEGHGDNLAAALTGGVCLTWGTRIARIAATAPATPIAVVPEHRVETAASRAALPDTVPHADAAFSAGHAALLGAALFASGIIREQMVPLDAPTEFVIDTWPFASRMLTDRGCKAGVSSWTRISDNSMPPRAKVFSNYHNGRLGILEHHILATLERGQGDSRFSSFWSSLLHAAPCSKFGPNV
jgi:shikimate kinase